jgi:isopentenyl-diphosphate delta-isomerase
MLMKEELVILVDEQDNEIGVMPKMEAHKRPYYITLFFVFILNDLKELIWERPDYYRLFILRHLLQH